MALSATILLIGKLGAILENERSTIADVRDEVDKIKRELLTMKAFLEDADVNNKTQTEVDKLWVASIRDLAFDVEDIIDEFMYHMHEKQSGSRLSRGVRKTLQCPSNLWFRFKFARKLQKIKETIKAIPEMNQRYSQIGHVEAGASTSENIHDWVQNQAESSFYINEDELVGIEGKKNLLTGWLIDEEQYQSIVYVVGMGGSGKTTLVAKIFNNQSVERRFDCYAWITVSQTYVVVDLFRRLIMELYKSRNEDFPSNLNAKSRMELLVILVDYLESKKYLVVLDDVWNVQVWREIAVALQDRQHGSRIIVTTRKEDVSTNSFGVKSHVHHIQPLLKNEAWELFCRNSFSSNHDRTCPPDLVPLACQLVEKCEGLPLAIVALGGLMSSKKSKLQWEKVCNGLNWHLQNNALLDPVRNILLLSFNELPSPLKHCFLYCSLFPEDFVIKRKRLIRSWIAEEFVEHVRGLTPEEVADEYLMELCLRSMLQVVGRNEIRPKQVKMHDLMRELALSTSEKEKFGFVYDGTEVMEEISTRRLSIYTTRSNGGEFELCSGMSKIRTFLLFYTDMSSLSFSNTLASRFKLLRSLDLEDARIDKLPDAVFYLFNLRNLNLKNTLIKELPESIGRLHSLQYLDILDTKIESLPQGISKLLNLRHLIMFRYSESHHQFKFFSGTRVPSSICKLQKLQYLTCIESEGNITRLIGTMTQLRRIGISNLIERDEKDLWVSIEKMTLLQYLTLMARNEQEILPVKAHCPTLPHIQKLYLSGRLRNVIPWFSSLQSLTTLLLHWSRLEEDILPQIEQLLNLTNLTLSNSYVGEELCFRRGFVKLVRLEFFNFSLLKEINIEQGVMPNLQHVVLRNCMKLKTVPVGLEYLSNLQILELMIVPMDIVQPIRKGGVDRHKVQHIPEIRHYFEQSSKRVYENLA